MVKKPKVATPIVECRPWEVWDKPGMAEHVDKYWRGSPDERAYRARLGFTVRSQMATPNDTILEVGCGTGLIYAELLGQVGPTLNYIGADNSPAMLAIARKRFPRAGLREGDAFNLPFKDGEFDVVACFEVLGHIPDNTQPIAELARVAKRKVIFTVWVGEFSEAQAAEDHYLHSKADIMARITQGMAGKPYRVDEKVMPYTTCFVVTKER